MFQVVELKFIGYIGAVYELAVFAIAFFTPTLMGVVVTEIEKHFLNYLAKSSIAFRIYSCNNVAGIHALLSLFSECRRTCPLPWRFHHHWGVRENTNH